MNSKRFDDGFLLNGTIPAKIVQLSQRVQALKSFSCIRAQQFAKLHEEREQIARIQSVKSSKALEGIITTDEHIRDIRHVQA